MIGSTLQKWQEIHRLDEEERRKIVEGHRRELRNYKVLYYNEKDRGPACVEEGALRGLPEFLAGLRSKSSALLGVFTQLQTAYRARSRSLEKETLSLVQRVKELSGRFVLLCRVRPILPHQSCYNTSFDRENVVEVVSPRRLRVDSERFLFDRVYNDFDSDEKMFQNSFRPLVESFLWGASVCFLAYGQTGSGKTYTIDNLVRRALRLVEARDKRRTEAGERFGVRVTEIYLERERVLLERAGLGTGAVASELDKCGRRRRVSRNELNALSNRAHTVVEIEREVVAGGGRSRKEAKMVFVDLAGIESNRFSSDDRAALDEARFINKSLSSLKTMVCSMKQGKTFASFRESKLTRLVYNSVVKNDKLAKVCMVITLNPSFLCKTDTLSSLRFAKEVANAKIGESKGNLDGTFDQMKKSIDSLKRKLDRQNK